MLLNYSLYAIAFTAAMVLSRLITPLFIRLARHTRMLDHPSEQKQHRNPTPFLGGVVIFISFWAVILAGLFAAIALPRYLNGVPEIHNISWFTKLGGVFLGGVLMLVVGILDDRFNMPPHIKFVGQALGALILLGIGLRVNLVQELGGFGYFITFIWIISLMNAFNFIDSIDAHCAGVAFVSNIILFIIANIVFQPILGILTIALAGALLGYLPYNWKPARIFLGDNGSLFLGYMMAAFTLLFTYSSSGKYSILTPFIPIFLFGVPLYDMISVVVVRLFRGIPPWKGDRNHFAHRLVRLGMNEKIACMVSFFIVFTLGLVAILSTQVHTTIGKFVISILFISVISIIAILEYYAASRIRVMEVLAGRHKRRREDIQAAEDKKVL